MLNDNQEKPELIVVSQNLLGGGASFHRNMLVNFPKNLFDIKCIYLDPAHWSGPRSTELKLQKNDTIFYYGIDSEKEMAKRFSNLVANREGVIITNLEEELICLDIYPKKKKTIYFICHDAGYLSIAVKYQSLINVFIAHNIAVYNELRILMKNREKDIYFIEHGVKIPIFIKEHFPDQNLKLVFLARHHEIKGIFDLPKINDILIEKGICVDWTILGDGLERPKLMKMVENQTNFQFQIPSTTEEVINILKTQDIFILPSRHDGLPVALLEAMSAGCVPVISNFSEGIKKVVTDKIGFVLPMGDNNAIAEKIALLLHNRDLLKTMSDNCINRIKDDFDIEKQALKYYQLYKEYKRLKNKPPLTIKDLCRKAKYYKVGKRFFSLIRKVGLLKS